MSVKRVSGILTKFLYGLVRVGADGWSGGKEINLVIILLYIKVLQNSTVFNTTKLNQRERRIADP